MNKEKKDIFFALLTLTLVSLTYFTYLYYVGIPLTKASNSYNQALLNYREKNYDTAEEAIENSLLYYSDQKSIDLQTEIKKAKENSN